MRGLRFPFAPRLGFVSPFPARGGGFPGNGFEFQANLGARERERYRETERERVGEWSRSQKRFQELLEVVMLQARELFVSM